MTCPTCGNAYPCGCEEYPLSERTLTMHGNIPSISISGAPTIEFRFAGDTCTADLAGAHLYAEVRDDESADMRVTDASGFVLANVVVNGRPERTLTENVMDIGSALLWSHWRFTEAQAAQPSMSATPEKHAAE